MGKILSAFKGRKGHWVVKYPYELPSLLLPPFHKIYEIGMKEDFRQEQSLCFVRGEKGKICYRLVIFYR